jgi:hypothetical protein
MAPTLAGIVTTRFCVWGYIKDNAYCNNPCNVDELKTNISNITANISPMKFQEVSTNMLYHARLCMQHAGAHLQPFLQHVL